MREIVSPLSGISSPFGRRRDPYRVLGFNPPLVADFGAEYYRANGARTTFGGLITQTRASNATMVDSTGTLVTVGPNVPRIGHHVWNGSAWVNEGLLHESEARTNLLLNSATLSTQDVTVTAVPHTLHFTGTGTITLSGASTAGPLVGTGTGENNRVSLTFTPSAGTLTLTVSGTVTNADLEVGSTLSSHKPTSGSTATRAAETLTIPSANLPWPTPRVIGPEAVTNGTFDSDVSGWTPRNANTVLSQVSSQMQVETGAAEFAYAYQTLSATVGKVYLLSYEYEVVSGGGRVYVGDFAGTLSYGDSGAFTGSGSNQILFVAGNTTPVISFIQSGATTGLIARFDNISVREIDPLAVSIQMEGAMTYADTGNTSEARFLRWYAGGNDYFIHDLQTDSGRTGRLAFIQRALASGVDVVYSSSTTYSPGVFVPFNIASRHGSTFINGAVDGTALTANTTPLALPDLSATDLELGYDYMGTIKTFRIWADDIGDTGIAEASS